MIAAKANLQGLLASPRDGKKGSTSAVPHCHKSAKFNWKNMLYPYF